MKHVSKIVLSLLVTGLLAAAVQAEPGVSEAGVAQPSWVRVTGDRVNLRARPSFENSEVLGQADYDERLEVLMDMILQLSTGVLTTLLLLMKAITSKVTLWIRKTIRVSDI